MQDQDFDQTSEAQDQELGTSKDQELESSSQETEVNDESEQVEESSEQPSQPQNDEVKPQRNFEAEVGKMSKLEREKNEALKRADEESQRAYRIYASKLNSQDGVNDLNQTFQSSPNDYEWFRQNHLKQTGQDLGSYESVYGQPVRQATSYGAQQQNFDPETIKEIGRQGYYESKEQDETLNEFIREFPEVNSPMSEEENKKTLEAYNQALRIAMNLKKEMGGHLKDHLIPTFRALPQNRGKYDQRLQEQARLQGAAEVLGNGAGASGSVQGGQSNGSKEADLTSEDEYVMKKLGIINDPKARESFIRNKSN